LRARTCLLERVLDGGTKISRRHGARAFSCRGLAPIGAGLLQFA
jgi:hypothetical protein